jgi:GLPGLI family protein
MNYNMKYIGISFLILLFHFSGFTQPNEIDKAKWQVNYLLTFCMESERLRDKKEEEMILLIGDNVSLFRSIPSLVRDSIIENFKGPNRYDLIAEVNKHPVPAMNWQVFKNYPQGNMTTIDKILIFQEKYLYEEPMNKIAWEIKTETKVISGLKCQLATTKFGGRNYEAWFSKEIPISEGPYKFHGLPGLIVHIYDNKGFYDFKLQSAKKITYDRAIKFNKSNVFFVSKQQFINKYRQLFKDPQGELMSMSPILKSNPEIVNSFGDEVKKIDNLIELDFH